MLTEITTYKNKELLNEDFSLAKLPKLRDDFIAKLENALMLLSYKDLSMWHNEIKSKVDLRQFDGAWLTDISLRHNDTDGFCLSPFGDLQVTPDMFPKLNLKTMNLEGEIGYLNKVKFLDATEKRHLENYRYIFSLKNAFLDYGKQKWWTDENGYGFNKISTLNDTKVIIPTPISLKGGYYLDKCSVRDFMSDKLKDENGSLTPWGLVINSLHMALQLSLTYYYEWSCYIKESNDSLGIRIPIHPSSSKEVFMLRNLPEGNLRKRAIVNFVKEHYRTISGNNNERDVLIKQHLRGDLKFRWRGLEVHITPSPYDLLKTKTKLFKQNY